jgi:hypothetical protein
MAHTNARLNVHGRRLLVGRVRRQGWAVAHAARPRWRPRCHGAFVRGTTRPLSGTPARRRTRRHGGAPPPDQVIAHTNLYWTYQTAPGRTAGTVETKDVDFGGTS